MCHHQYQSRIFVLATLFLNNGRGQRQGNRVPKVVEASFLQFYISFITDQDICGLYKFSPYITFIPLFAQRPITSITRTKIMLGPLMIHILLDLGLIYITEVLFLCFTKQQNLFLATGTKLDPVFSAFCSLLDLPLSRTICLKRSILVYCWMDEDDIFAQIGQIFFDTFF